MIEKYQTEKNTFNINLWFLYDWKISKLSKCIYYFFMIPVMIEKYQL